MQLDNFVGICTLEGLQTDSICLQQRALNNILCNLASCQLEKSEMVSGNRIKKISVSSFMYLHFPLALYFLLLTFSRPLKLSRSGLGLWHST